MTIRKQTTMYAMFAPARATNGHRDISVWSTSLASAPRPSSAKTSHLREADPPAERPPDKVVKQEAGGDERKPHRECSGYDATQRTICIVRKVVAADRVEVPPEVGEGACTPRPLEPSRYVMYVLSDGRRRSTGFDPCSISAPGRPRLGNMARAPEPVTTKGRRIPGGLWPISPLGLRPF